MNNENIYTPTHLSQATTAIQMSANCDACNHALDVENSVVCSNAVEQTMVMPLSKPRGGSPDVKASVASKIPEDFTAHLEVHPLRHI